MKDQNILQYQRLYKNNNRNRTGRKRRNVLSVGAILVICAVILTVVLILSGNAVRTHAASICGEKYYKSVTIGPGDTLWSIAEEYMDSNAYSDAREYIREVKDINSLETDTINSGCHLIVPYFVSE